MLEVCLLDLADLPDDLDLTPRVFSPARLKKLSALRHKEDRLRSVAAELCLARVCLRCGVAQAMPITYRYTDSGKPELCNSRFHISISHCGNYAAASLSDQPHGIDLEQLSRAQQIKRVLRLPDNTTEQSAVQQWCAREGFLKMMGKGIRLHQDFRQASARIGFDNATAYLQYLRHADAVLCAVTQSKQELHLELMTRQIIEEMLNFQNKD